jgi:hypothetical protein
MWFSGGNPDFKELETELGIEEQKGTFLNFNNSSQAETAANKVQEMLKADPNIAIMVAGYSRGGQTAVTLVNKLTDRGIPVSVLITIDPHNMVGNLGIPAGSVSSAINFYQDNPTTGGGGVLPIGQNPYNGSPVENAQNVHVTDDGVNHLNIVDTVRDPEKPYRKKVDEARKNCK